MLADPSFRSLQSRCSNEGMWSSVPEGKAQDSTHFSQFIIFTEMCQLDVNLCKDREATVNNPDLIRAHTARAAEPGPTRRGGTGRGAAPPGCPEQKPGQQQASGHKADSKGAHSHVQIRVPEFQHASAYRLPLTNKRPLSRVS